MHADEELLNHVRRQRDDLAEKFHRLHLENDALRREVREMTAKARERAQPKVEGLRCPINFSKPRTDCPLSWQLTAKARQYGSVGRVVTVADFLEAGWTPQTLKEYGLIEPKA